MKKKIDKAFETFNKGFEIMGEFFEASEKVIDDVFEQGMKYTPPKNFKKYVITKFNNLGVVYYLTYDNTWTPTFFASENLTEHKVALFDVHADAEKLVNQICEKGHQGVFTILTVFKG